MNYRYYRDITGNEYRWSIQPESNGKYYATIFKLYLSGNRCWFNKGKERTFKLRRMAKSWCLKHVREAKKRQQKTLDNRATRKQERDALKPVYTKQDLKFQDAQKNIKRLKANIKRADSKIKSLTTRRHTYEKQIKVNQRRIEKMVGLL